jgi:hypothetical protein
MRTAFVWVLVACLALVLVNCSDDNGNGGKKDTGPTADGPQKTDGKTARDQSPGSEGISPDGPSGSDGSVTFNREVTFGYDTGLPALKLTGLKNAKGHLKVVPEAKLLPVEVRKIKIIPVTAYSFTLTVSPDQGGSPGGALVTKQITVKAGDVDKWFEIDISTDKVVVQGAFWVTMKYASDLKDNQQVVYGGTASSGQNIFDNPPYPLYTVNFDQIMRVVVGTPNTDTPKAKGKKGDTCSFGVDCQSGYCSGKTCVETCTADGDCGAGGKCRSFHMGKKICVKGCTKSADCATGAFCLTDTTFFASGFCVKGGPFATGQNCQYNYHTACAEGYCTACDKDPTKCEDPGTCKKAP